MDELDTEDAGDGGVSDPQQTEPVFPTPNERHLARLRSNPGLADQFDVKFGAGAAARHLGIGTSPLAQEIEQDGTIDAVQRHAAITEAAEAANQSIAEAWEAGRRKVQRPDGDLLPDQVKARRGMALGEAGKLDPEERMPAAVAERETARRSSEMTEAAAGTIEQAVGKNTRPPGAAGGLLQVTRGLFRSAADDQSKRLEHAERMVRGEADLPEYAAWRNAVDRMSKSVVDFAAAKPLEYAGILGGLAGDKLGLDIKPEDNAAVRLGKRIEDYAKQKFPGDEARQYEFLGKVAEGIGSTAAFGGTGLIIRMAGAGERGTLAAIALSGAAGNVPDEFEKASKAVAGGTASEMDRFINLVANSALGSTEALPFVGPLTRRGASGAGAALKRTAQQAVDEGGQEFVQQLGTNISAKTTYDPSRDPYEGVLEGTAVAGITGGAFGAGMSRAQGRAERDEDRERIIREIADAIKGDEPGSTSDGTGGTRVEPSLEPRPDLPASSAPKPRTDAEIAAAPSFEDMRAALPKDAQGLPDLEPLVAQLAERGVNAWGKLTPEQKAEIYRTFKPVADAVAQATAGEEPVAGNAGNRDSGNTGISGTPTAAQRAAFDKVLTGKTARKGWAKAAGVSEAQLKPLIDEAVADGRLAMVKGQPRRTGKKAKAPAAGNAGNAGNAIPAAKSADLTRGRKGDSRQMRDLRAQLKRAYSDLAHTKSSPRLAHQIAGAERHVANLEAKIRGDAVPSNQQILSAAQQSGRLEIVTVGDKPRERVEPRLPMPEDAAEQVARARREGEQDDTLSRAREGAQWLPNEQRNQYDLETTQEFARAIAAVDREIAIKSEERDRAQDGSRLTKSRTASAKYVQLRGEIEALQAERADLVESAKAAADFEAQQGNLFDEPQPGEGIREDAPELPRDSEAGDVREPESVGDAGGALPAERPGSGGDVRGGRGATDQPAGPGERDAGRADEEDGASATDGERDRNQRARLQSVIAETEREVEKARTEKSRRNYRITDADEIGQGGAKAKVRANIEAIRIVRNLEEEKREATEDERKALVKYVGWGAFAQAMFIDRKPEFEKERAQLTELLSPEEYEAARRSTQNAHYTSPEVIKGMWAALDHMGFTGGRAIEPAAGAGHFIGMVPDALAGKTEWTAVEQDLITGAIAKALYTGSDVRVQGFETVNWPDGFFDLAISNVPFGNYPIRDTRYKRTFNIHDYFFIKALDKVRPGGVVAFITSSGTLDKAATTARREMAQRATFLGAVRLPGGKKGAFAGNAGTEVTTDIIFLRRRMEGEPIGDQSWLDLKEIKTKEGPAEINAYFADHPEMMLGEMRLTETMYGTDEPVLIGSTENIDERIVAAVRAGIPAGSFVPRTPTTVKEETEAEVDSETDGIKEGAFYDKGGTLYRKVAGVGVPQKAAKADADRIRAFMGLRDVVNMLLAKQARGDQMGLDDLREALGKTYDAFVKKFGPINKAVRSERTDKNGRTTVSVRRPNLSAFRDDPDAFKVAAIENYDEQKDTASKAAIFTADVVGSYRRPVISGPADALAVSLNEKGGIDMPFIASLLDTSEAGAAEALGDKVYLNPAGDVWQTADVYLSGDVVEKLEAAKAAAEIDPKYARNVDALEAAQPPLLTRDDIFVPFGAPWIPVADYVAFLRQLTGAGRYVDIDLRLNPVTKAWSIEGKPTWPASAVSQYATERKKLTEVIEAAINSTPIRVTETHRNPDGSTTTVFLPEQTAEVQAKVKAIREAWAGSQETGTSAWVWEDEKRASRVEALYNATFNRLVPLVADGSHLTLPGLASSITTATGQIVPFELRPHQKNAVWRTIVYGNTLFDHTVGAGKTFAMIASVMEQKRLGIVQRPMVAVPNHMLEQFSREWLQAYPNAKLLVADKDSMSKDKRREFAARVAAEKWDGIIITHSAFGRIRMSDAAYNDFYKSQIDELQDAIDEEVASGKRKNDPTVKQLERMKETLKARLEKLTNKERKDEGITFEELGVDHITVDEAHLFKNLSLVTRHTRVKGLATSASQRSTDLFLKIQHIEKSRPGRAVTFATGTPVSNTMAEMFTMQRYLQLDQLQRFGIDKFDAWASTFGEITTQMELKEDGRSFQEVTSFSRFVNIPELVQIYSRVADTMTADRLNLPRPKLKGGTVGVVDAEMSPAEEAHMATLIKRAEDVRGGKVKPEEDNMLAIITEGRKLATDIRLIDETAAQNPKGKIARAVENIARIYEEGNADKKAPNKAQIVFLDMGVPGRKRSAPKAVAAPAKGSDSQIEAIRKAIKSEAVEDEDTQVDEAEGREEQDFFTGNFNLYDAMADALVAKGVPRAEIAYIHDAKTDEQKAKLFSKVRSGEVRVLFGSTGKMGVGTNVQTRLIAMHHIDAPWKPAEVEQRDGRILRQGNLNPEIEIYRYVTKKSLDAFMWQTLERKANFIAQLRAGAKGIRSAEDIDNPLPEAAALKAAASGDPRIMEYAELTKEQKELEAAKRAQARSADNARRSLADSQARIAKLTDVLARYEADAAKVTETKGDAFAMTLTIAKGAKVTDRRKAADTIRDYVHAVGSRIWSSEPTEEDVATISGFDVVAGIRRTSEGVAVAFRIRGEAEYGQDARWFAITEKSDMLGTIRRVENMVAEVPVLAQATRIAIEQQTGDLAKLEKQSKPQSFAKEGRLAEVTARMAQIRTETAEEAKAAKGQSESVEPPPLPDTPTASEIINQRRYAYRQIFADDLEKQRAVRTLRSGKTYALAPDVVDSMRAMIKGLPNHILPAEYQTSFFRVARPSGDGRVEAVFERFDGSMASVTLTFNEFSGATAVSIADPAAGSIVGFLVFGLAHDLANAVRAELYHEAVHALRAAGKLDGLIEEIVAHAAGLQILEMEYRQFRRGLGDPQWEDYADATIAEIYAQAYSGRQNMRSLLEEEAVAHMAQLLAAGVPLPLPENIRRIFEAIETGALARGEFDPQSDAGGSMFSFEAVRERETLHLLASHFDAVPIAEMGPDAEHPGRVIADVVIDSDGVMTLGDYRPGRMYATGPIDQRTGREMRRSIDSLGFYSKLDEVLSSLNPKDKVTLQTLTSKGVKASEIEARGLKEALDAGAVPVSSLIETAGRNRVEVREQVYGGAGTPEAAQRIADLQAEGEALAGSLFGVSRNRGRLDEITREMNQLAPPSKWSSFSLDPSNPSYRETVLHLPPDVQVLTKEWSDFVTAMKEKYNAGDDWWMYLNDEESKTRLLLGDRLPIPQENFRQHHFPDVPNVIGHMMTSMVKHEGRPVYLIDQIQSDWGQKLRDGGVRDEAKIAELKRRKADAYTLLNEQRPPEFPPQEIKRVVDAIHYFGSIDSLRAAHRAVPTGGRAELVFYANMLTPELLSVAQSIKLIEAELETAEAVTPGHPLVNTTDQWTNTTLRRALRQAAEADADYIAIPHGDTVLSYNPGDTNGMRQFYGSRDETGIVPKNLRNLLSKIDKSTPAPMRVEKLETPSGRKGWKDDNGTAYEAPNEWASINVNEPIEPKQTGFTLFPLTDKVKQSVISDGQVMFAFSDPTAPYAERAAALGFGQVERSTEIIARVRDLDQQERALRKQITPETYDALSSRTFDIESARQFATQAIKGMPDHLMRRERDLLADLGRPEVVAVANALKRIRPQSIQAYKSLDYAEMVERIVEAASVDRKIDPAQKVYHGTEAAFETYDSNVARSVSQASRDAEIDVMFVTPRKEFAKQFGDNVKELMLQPGYYFDVNSPFDLAQIAPHINSRSNAASIWRKIGNPTVQSWGVLESADMLRALKDLGYDGVRMSEEFYNKADRKEIAPTIAVFVKGQVRRSDGQVMFAFAGTKGAAALAKASRAAIDTQLDAADRSAKAASLSPPRSWRDWFRPRPKSPAAAPDAVRVDAHTGAVVKAPEEVALMTASAMHAGGASADEIFAATGATRIPGTETFGFEIDDSQAKWKDGTFKSTYFDDNEYTYAESRNRSIMPSDRAKGERIRYGSPQSAPEAIAFRGRLGDLFDHPKLFSAYPLLSNVAVTVVYGPRLPFEMDGTGVLRIKQFKKDGKRYEVPSIIVRGRDADVARKALLHEIQHYIARKEGWPEGTAPGNLAPSLRRKRQWYSSTEDGMLPLNAGEYALATYWDIIARMEKDYQDNPDMRDQVAKSAFKELIVSMAIKPDDYANDAGEILAEGTANRADLTAAERRGVAPFSADQIAAENFGADTFAPTKAGLRKALDVAQDDLTKINYYLRKRAMPRPFGKDGRVYGSFEPIYSQTRWTAELPFGDKTLKVVLDDKFDAYVELRMRDDYDPDATVALVKAADAYARSRNRQLQFDTIRLDIDAARAVWAYDPVYGLDDMRRHAPAIEKWLREMYGQDARLTMGDGYGEDWSVTMPDGTQRRLTDNPYEDTDIDLNAIRTDIGVGNIDYPHNLDRQIEKRSRAGMMFAFAGEKAATADRAALARAKTMESEGWPRHDIWLETGWFRDPGKGWRFEVNDQRAVDLGASSIEYLRELAAAHKGTLDKYFFSAEIFDAYPQLRKLMVERVTPKGAESAAYLRRETGLRGLFRSLMGEDKDPRIQITSRSDRNSLLHEVQHAIDDIEGAFEGVDRKDPYHETGYSGASFEKSARAVEHRSNLSASQRAARPPWLDWAHGEGRRVKPELQQFVPNEPDAKKPDEPLTTGLGHNQGPELSIDDIEHMIDAAYERAADAFGDHSPAGRVILPLAISGGFQRLNDFRNLTAELDRIKATPAQRAAAIDLFLKDQDKMRFQIRNKIIDDQAMFAFQGSKRNAIVNAERVVTLAGPVPIDPAALREAIKTTGVEVPDLPTVEAIQQHLTANGYGAIRTHDGTGWQYTVWEPANVIEPEINPDVLRDEMAVKAERAALMEAADLFEIALPAGVVTRDGVHHPSDPDNPMMFAIRAFHGSPYDFDRFDLKHLGRGEGAPGQMMFAFAGKKARGADLAALAHAERLERDRATPDEIWMMTGWFRGRDGEWRWEISDDRARMRKVRIGEQYMADEAIVHKDLFASYPALGDITVYPTSGSNGAFVGDGSLNVGMNPRGSVPPISIALHELQHAIQQMEGFARGGNSAVFTPEQAEAERGRLQAMQDAAPPDPIGWDSVGNSIAPAEMSEADLRWSLYSRLAGEVEARTVERRRTMTPAERRAVPPWISQDVDNVHQIIRMRTDQGVELSIDPSRYGPEVVDTELPELPDGRRALIHGSAVKVDRLTASTNSPEFGPAIFLSAPTVAQTGHAYTYTVAADLSPDDVWDLTLPIPQQSERVQDALADLGVYRPGGDPRSAGALRAAEALGEDLGLTLTAAGIKALRNTGRRAHGPEYVVFDESLLEIVRTVDAAGAVVGQDVEPTSSDEMDIDAIMREMIGVYGFRNVTIEPGAIEVAQKGIDQIRALEHALGLPAKSIGTTIDADVVFSPTLKGRSGSFKPSWLRRGGTIEIADGGERTLLHEWFHAFDRAARAKDRLGYFRRGRFATEQPSPPFNSVTTAMVAGLAAAGGPVVPFNIVAPLADRLLFGGTLDAERARKRFPWMSAKVAEGFSELAAVISEGHRIRWRGKSELLDRVKEAERRADEVWDEYRAMDEAVNRQYQAYRDADPSERDVKFEEWKSASEAQIAKGQEWKEISEAKATLLENAPIHDRGIVRDWEEGQRGYFTRPVEIAARAFETYVAAKTGMVEIGEREQPYLKPGTPQADRVVAAFDKIFGNMRVDADNRMMFAMGPSRWRRSGDSIAAAIEKLKDVTGMTVLQGLRGITLDGDETTIRMRPGDGKNRGTTADGRPRQRFGNTWIGARRIEAQYDNYSGVARMRSVRRLDETAHEAAHHLERIVGAPLLDLQTQFGAELDGMAVPGLADTRSEQFAEWFRLYITNPDAARLAAPGLYDAFEDVVDAEIPGMLAGLEAVQGMIADYNQQSPLDQVASDLVAARHRNLVQRAYGSYRDGTLAGDIAVALSRFYTATYDRMNPIWKVTSALLSIADRNGVRGRDGKPISLRVAENPYKLMRTFAGSYKKGHNWLVKGIRDTDGTEIAPPLRDALIQVFGAGSESGLGSTAAAGVGAVAGAVGLAPVTGPIVGAVAGSTLTSLLYGKATDRMRGTGWDAERYQKFNAYVMAQAALGRYAQYEAKQEMIAATNAMLNYAAVGRPAIAEAAAKAKAVLERRQEAAIRIDTLLKDRRRDLSSTDTEVRRIAQQLDAKKDDVLAAQMGRDDALAKRRDDFRRELEKRQQEAVREAEAAQQEVDGLEIQQAMIEAEIDQLREAADKAAARLEGLDNAVRQLRAARERELGSGIHRPPVLEVKDKLIATIEEAERLYPEFVDAARIFHEFAHGLLVMEYRAGFHSPEQFAALAANKDWYAPLMRDLSDIREAKYSDSGLGAKWQKYQALKGSDRAVLNPVDVIIERAYALSRKTAYDAAIKSLVQLVQRAGPGSGVIAEEVERSEVLADTQATLDRIVASAKALGLDDVEAARIMHLMEHELAGSDVRMLSAPTGRGPKQALQVPYWENGERKMLRINDPDFAVEVFQSLNGIGEDLHHWLVQTVAVPSRWLSFGVTAHPAFAIVNMTRDMMAAWITTGATPVYTQAKGIAMELSTHKAFDSDLWRAWSPAWMQRKVEEWREFVRGYHDAGGIRGGQFTATLGDVKDKAEWRGLRREGFNIEFRRLWDAIELAETSTRLGVARMAMKRAKAFDPTLSDTEALQEGVFTARDVMDFDRRGSLMGAFTRMVAFLNPNLQGIDKAVRTGVGSGDRGSAIRRKLQIVMKRDAGIELSAAEERDLADAYKFWFRLMAFNAGVVAIYLLHAGDPEEDEITDRMKQSHSMIDVANIWHNLTTGKIGSWFGLEPAARNQENWKRAPLPFELATPAIISIWALRTHADRDPDAYARLWDSLHDLLAPPVIPQLWKVVGEPSMNSSSFTGRNIVPPDLQKLDPAQRYEWFNSTIAKKIGAELNVSPMKVDYVITNGLGYMGREIQRYGEWMLPGGRQRPGQDEDMLTKRVKADPYKASNALTEFYRQMRPDGGISGPVSIIKGIIVHDGEQYVQAAAGYRKIIDEQNPIAAKSWLASKPDEMRAYATLMGHFNTAAQNIHPINRLDKVVQVVNRMQREILNGELKEAIGPRRRRNITLESVLKAPTPQDEEVLVDILNRVKVTEARNTFIAIGHGRWGGPNQKPLPIDLVLDELRTANSAVYDELTKRIQMTRVPSLEGAAAAWKKAKPLLLKEQEEAVLEDYGFDGRAQIGTREERRQRTPRVLAR